MSRIFISHSSKDNVAAVAFKQWLGAYGWPDEDVFLDLDSIGAGERWKEALNKANARCEAVILLASPEALSSAECVGEVRKAEDFGKEIVIVLLRDLQIEDHRLDSFKDRQIVDLATPPQSHVEAIDYRGEHHEVRFNAAGLARVGDFLEKRGITPDRFAWPPLDRPNADPFPGLSAFTEDDAGIFFGRDADIVRGLDRLRILRRNGRPRLLVIQAASGAGKSSFLRAGLWPRLVRDPDFAPLAILRPAQGILTGAAGLGGKLAARLSRPGQPVSPGEIHARLMARDTAKAAADFTRLMQTTAVQALDERRIGDREAPAPVLVIAVDQAEELLGADDKAEGDRFLFQLASLLRAPPPGVALFCLFTIRSDGAAQLFQRVADLDLELPETLPLLPLPQTAYRDVILKPLEVLARCGQRLILAPALAERLVADATGADALPLLAFTISHLYREFAATGNLTLEQYDSIGGVTGSINMALKQALAKPSAAPAIPAAREEQFALLRATFIPWLARVDPETGVSTRRVAPLGEFPPSARGMVERLIETRLLVADRRSSTDVVEVAHECLLRQWPALTAWLQADADDLKLVGAVERASDEWVHNGRQGGWLDHRAERLDAAEHVAMREDFGRRLGNDGIAYLEACRARETAERDEKEAALRHGQSQVAKTRKLQKRASWALAAVCVTILAALAATLSQSYETSKREAAVFAGVAQSASLQGFCDRSLRLAVAGLPPGHGASPLSFRSPELESSLAFHALAAGCFFEFALPNQNSIVDGAAFSPDGTRLITTSSYTARLWDAKTGAALATLSRPSDLVESAAFSLDGTRIVTASLDGSARVWDAKTGVPIATLSGHTRRLVSAVFSPDGTRVLTASTDNTARLWNAETGAAIVTMSGHTNAVNSAAFSPDGSRIVTASNDKTARLWDGRTGAALLTFSGHTDKVNGASFSPDGSRIVTASDDKTARVWDAKTGAPLAMLSGHVDAVDRAAFSPSGTRIVTASYDHNARLWDAKTGAALATLAGHTNWVVGVGFNPRGSTIVTASWDNTARLWDGTTGAPLATLSGHAGPVNTAVFSPDGTRVVTASFDGTARLWNFTAGAAAITLSARAMARVFSASFSSDGTSVLTVSTNNTARLWDAKTGAALATMSGHTDTLNSAAFSPDGSRIVTASNDKTARLWDGRTGAALLTFLGHTDKVNSASFSPDGSRIVTASDDKTARVWDAKTGGTVRILSDHTGKKMRSAEFSPDGTRVVTAAGREVIWWDVATGSFRTVVVGRDPTFSPDGLHVLTVNDGRALLWDAATGELVVLSARVGLSTNAAFSPDGNRLLTLSADFNARLWDAKTGAAIAVLSGHNNIVLSAAFSVDGKFVATASNDNTARIWDAKSGTALDTLSGHTGAVNSVAFSPDGTRVVTASADGTARIWQLDPLVLMRADQRQAYVCRERLIGAQSFADEEMADPILRGRQDLRNPCDRVGPLSSAYYWRAAVDLAVAIRGAL